MSESDACPQDIVETAEAALGRWGIAPRAALRLVKYRENAVFEVTSPDGGRFALRVHRRNYHTDAELESELAWMAALRSAGIATPEALRAADGRAFCRIECRAGAGPYQCDLMRWIDAAPLGSIGDSMHSEVAAGLFRTIGRLAAQLHEHGRRWPRPTGFTRKAWDEAGLLGDSPVWGRFWELEQLTAADRRLLQEARRKASVCLREFGRGADRYGLIHADLVPENLLAGAGGIYVIDFDDAGFGWHLFELATALYFHLEEPYFPAARADLIAGYRELAALPDEHVRLLPMFLLLRGLTYLGWAHTRRNTDTAREFAAQWARQVTALAGKFAG